MWCRWLVFAGEGLLSGLGISNAFHSGSSGPGNVLQSTFHSLVLMDGALCQKYLDPLKRNNEKILVMKMGYESSGGLSFVIFQIPMAV